MDEIKKALNIAAEALDIASDWNVTNVQVNPPKEWKLEAYGEDTDDGWCSTEELAQKLRSLAQIQALSDTELYVLQTETMQKGNTALEILISEELDYRGFFECDMCGMRITDVRTRIVIKGSDWDLCQLCWKKFHPTITFLAIIVGVNMNLRQEKVENESPTPP